MTKYGRPARLTWADEARVALFEAMGKHAPEAIGDLADKPLARYLESATSQAPETERALEDAVRAWQTRWKLPADWCRGKVLELLESWTDGLVLVGEVKLDTSFIRAWPDDRSCFEIEGETVTVEEPGEPEERARRENHRRWLASRGVTPSDTLRPRPREVWRAMAWHPEYGETRADVCARLLAWARDRVAAYLDRVEAALSAAGPKDRRELVAHAKLFVRHRICLEDLDKLAEATSTNRRTLTRAIARFARLVDV